MHRILSSHPYIFTALACVVLSVLLAAGIEVSRLMGSASTAQSVISVRFIASGAHINLTAIPEKRIPSTHNDSTHLTVEVRNPGSTTALLAETVTTTLDGTSAYFNTGMTPGLYDITAKGYSHLRVKKANVNLVNGMSLDFTDAGLAPLPSGDVNGSDGDNKVNGIDLSLIVGGLLGASERLDLNQDGRVNGIDLTNAVVHLNETGAS